METSKIPPLNILIIEDSDFDAELMIMRLQTEGFSFQYTRVQTKEEFLAAISPDVDIILSDWSLPQFSGLAALKLMKDLKYEIPFIIISGSIGEEAALEAMRLGAYDYILKDRPDRLGQAIRNAYEQVELQNTTRKAQEALAASEAELRALFASMQDLVLVLDGEGNYQRIAPTNFSLLANPPEKLLKMNLSDVFPPDQAYEYKQVIKKVLHTKKAESIEFSLNVHGEIKWFFTTVSPKTEESVIWVERDITDRKKAESSIYLQSAALNAAENAIQITDPTGAIEWVNPAFTKLTGYEENEIIGKTPKDMLRSGMHSAEFYEGLWDLIRSGKSYHGEIINKRKNGEIYTEDTTITPLIDAEGKITHYITIKQDITERKRDEKALQDREERYRALFKDNQSVILLIDPATGLIEDTNLSAAAFYGWSLDEMKGMKISEINTIPLEQIQQNMQNAVEEKLNYFHFKHRLRNGEIRDVEVYSGPIKLDNRTLLYSMVHDITERRVAENALRNHLQRQERIVELSTALSATVELENIYQTVRNSLRKIIPFDTLGITLLEKEEMRAVFVDQQGQQIDKEFLISKIIDFTKPGCGRIKAILESKTNIETDCFKADCDCNGLLNERTGDYESAMFVPLVADGKVIGTIDLLSFEKNYYQSEDSNWIGIVANLTALNIQNARLFSNTNKRLAELAALHAIDTVVTSSHSQEEIFKVLLDQTSSSLGMDAADILLLDETGQTLSYAYGYGFASSSIKNLKLKLGESYAGKVAEAKKSTLFFDLSVKDKPDWIEHGGHVKEFNAYICTPLVLENETIGVLELFHKTKINPDADWLRFLDLLASQAAIAASHLKYFQEIQTANMELLQAYDATIEGWSQAMDLRDEETEGHTQRVTDLTMKLARKMGLDDDALIHIRRGALLHDIGKLGVPDNILLKPGPLTDEEWMIMRKHPLFAYHMLNDIAYLKPALDIPYCHHEKWDGNGYPRGLMGQEIPIAARIFSVIDVWDALTSDRPYRPAWSKEKTLDYIQSQAGLYFDPEIVPVFLSLIED